MNIEEILKQKFTSANDTEVTRAVITRQEYEMILEAIIVIDHEKLADLGWQSVECPGCGSSFAVGYPKDRPDNALFADNPIDLF